MEHHVLQMLSEYVPKHAITARFAIDPSHVKIICAALEAHNPVAERIAGHVAMMRHVALLPISRLNKPVPPEIDARLLNIHIFSGVERLEFMRVDLTRLVGLELVAHQLVELSVSHCTVPAEFGTIVTQLLIECAREGCTKRRGKQSSRSSTPVGSASAVAMDTWRLLQSLTISHCQIVSLDGPCMKLFGSSLLSLKLTHNQIEDVAPLKHLTCLQSLDMSYNHVKQFSVQMAKLKQLNLAHNKLDDSFAVVGLNSLQQLSLAHNDVRRVETVQSTIQFLPELIRLELVSCPLTDSSKYRVQVFRCCNKRQQKMFVLDGKPMSVTERVAVRLQSQPVAIEAVLPERKITIDEPDSTPVMGRRMRALLAPSTEDVAINDSHGFSADIEVAASQTSSEMRLREATELRARVDSLKLSSGGSGWLKAYAEQTNTVPSTPQKRAAVAVATAQPIIPLRTDEAVGDTFLTPRTAVMRPAELAKVADIDMQPADVDFAKFSTPEPLKMTPELDPYLVQAIRRSQLSLNESTEQHLGSGRLSLFDGMLSVGELDVTLQLSNIYEVKCNGQTLTISARTTLTDPVVTYEFTGELESDVINSLNAAYLENVERGILSEVLYDLVCVSCTALSRVEFAKDERGSMAPCPACGSHLTTLSTNADVVTRTADNEVYALPSPSPDLLRELELHYREEQAAQSKFTSTLQLLDISTLLHLKLHVLQEQEHLLCWLPCAVNFTAKSGPRRLFRKRVMATLTMMQPAFVMLTTLRFVVFGTEASCDVLNTPKPSQMFMKYEFPLSAISKALVTYGRQSLQMSFDFQSVTSVQPQYKRTRKQLNGFERMQILTMDVAYLKQLAEQLTILMFDLRPDDRHFVSYDSWSAIQLLLADINEQIRFGKLTSLLHDEDQDTKAKIVALSQLCACHITGRALAGGLFVYQQLIVVCGFLCVVQLASDFTTVAALQCHPLEAITECKRMRLFDNDLIYYGVSINVQDYLVETYFPTVSNVERVLDALSKHMPTLLPPGFSKSTLV